MAKHIPVRSDLLSAAHATEIDWTYAAPLLKGVRRGQVPFVYFIGEQDDGPIKIGHAMDPIKRLRQLQTGNPRRLKIERLVYGNLSTEALLHEALREHVMGGKRRSSELNPIYARETEWFAAAARVDILDLALAINADTIDPESVEEVNHMVGVALEDFGYEIRRGDTVRQLAAGSGYVERGLRP